MTLANLVGVQGSGSCAGSGANQRAFLSASQAADARAGRRGSGHR